MLAENTGTGGVCPKTVEDKINLLKSARDR